jgi:hypothetical protein
MRRLLQQCVVLAVIVASVALAAPARANQIRVSVDTRISVGMYDSEGFPFSDEHCGLGGTTSQELAASDGHVHLGAGPQPLYASSVGPFVDGQGRPVDFFCGGEVSLCFFPTDVSVTAAGEVTVSMLASFYEGDYLTIGVPAWPCHAEDLVASSSVRLTVPAGSRGCVGTNVELGESESDHGTIGSFCVTVTPVGTEPSPSTPSPSTPPSPSTSPSTSPRLSLTALKCESLNATYTCDVTYSGGTAPVAIRWSVGGNPLSAYDDINPAMGTCVVDNLVAVRVVLTDAAGATTQRSVSTPCLGAGL